MAIQVTIHVSRLDHKTEAFGEPPVIQRVGWLIDGEITIPYRDIESTEKTADFYIFHVSEATASAYGLEPDPL